ncbi:MAG: A/G-specific adenine glycosylase [Bacteroidia bacterium]
MAVGLRIVEWYAVQGRVLPWRDTHDPYRIWLMEVVLQQTRIEQGIGYYHRLLDRFPDVQALAAADIDEVLKHWEGLGYYSRARNLHAAARQVVEVHGGVFPQHYTVLETLRGIGPYTARAIGAFAFGNETGVLDGNVMRVVSRYLGDFAPINQASTRKRMQAVVDGWVAGVDPRAFNHGMIDIGATVCTPTKPGCLICPLYSGCQAAHEGLTHLLPVKEKPARRVRYFHFYYLTDAQGAFVVRQRPARGLWGGLWELPNEEVDRAQWEARQSLPGAVFRLALKHVFTHFDMHIQVFACQAAADSAETHRGRFISTENIATFAFPRAMLNIFEGLGLGRFS